MEDKGLEPEASEIESNMDQCPTHISPKQGRPTIECADPDQPKTEPLAPARPVHGRLRIGPEIEINEIAVLVHVALVNSRGKTPSILLAL
jgi:hypothetical protein